MAEVPLPETVEEAVRVMKMVSGMISVTV